jgi:integrase
MLKSMQIKNLTKPGKYSDGNGLYLNIRSSGTKSWIYRYQINGKRKEIGLGSTKIISLKEARELAADATKLRNNGGDPKSHKIKLQADNNNTRTFEQCAAEYIKAHKPGWKNEKHASQWVSTLTQYAYPHIGTLLVGEIDIAAVMAVLNPIWRTKTETASRVRGRIENILSWAIVKGYRPAPNPAIWRGNLEILLPKRSKVQKLKHHPALPHADTASLMKKIRASKSVSARALEFTILTACRTQESIGAKWNEIDLNKNIWTIPAERMKAGREHRVPLSTQTISILNDLYRTNDYLFPGLKKGKPISNMAMLKFLKKDLGYSDITVHGFRSSFREWVSEVSTYSAELGESALAHINSNKVEAAYQRSDLLKKRCEMMQDWADYINQ